MTCRCSGMYTNSYSCCSTTPRIFPGTTSTPWGRTGSGAASCWSRQVRAFRISSSPLRNFVGGFASDNYGSSSENSNNNAWNQNFDNGNQKNNKRSTANAAAFELDYETNLVSLLDEINAGTYRVGRSLAFIVDRPVKREVFAADFRDRVVHHLLINRISPLLEREFIYGDMVLVHQDRIPCLPYPGHPRVSARQSAPLLAGTHQHLVAQAFFLRRQRVQGDDQARGLSLNTL